MLAHGRRVDDGTEGRGWPKVARKPGTGRGESAPAQKGPGQVSPSAAARAQPYAIPCSSRRQSTRPTTHRRSRGAGVVPAPWVTPEVLRRQVAPTREVLPALPHGGRQRAYPWIHRTMSRRRRRRLGEARRGSAGGAAAGLVGAGGTARRLPGAGGGPAGCRAGRAPIFCPLCPGPSGKRRLPRTAGCAAGAGGARAARLRRRKEAL